jgi:tetratricopeptide (TPR) repeat protein
MKRKRVSESDSNNKSNKFTRKISKDDWLYIKTYQKAAEQRVLEKDYSGAAETINKAIKMRPHDPRGYFEGALLSMHTDKPINMLRMCERVQLCTPTNHYWSNVAKGMIAEERFDIDKAIAHYNIALECNDATDDHFRATLYMGTMHRLKGDYNLAIEWYQAAFHIQKDLIDSQCYLLAACLWNVADTYFMCGDQEQAREYVAKSINICPAYIDIYFEQVREYMSYNKKSEALAMCDDLLLTVKQSKKTTRFCTLLESKMFR